MTRWWLMFGLLMPPTLLSQTAADRLLASRRYVAAGHLDSARAHLIAVAESIGGTHQALRAEAYVLLGVVEHLRGVDSLARAAFRAALVVDSGLSVEGLGSVAPGAAELFNEAQCELLNRRFLDSVGVGRCRFVFVRVDEPPRLLPGTRLYNPTPGVHGRVLVRAMVDSSGRAEFHSVLVVQGVDPDLDAAAVAFVLRARFEPARAAGRPVRALITLPFDFD